MLTEERIAELAEIGTEAFDKATDKLSLADPQAWVCGMESAARAIATSAVEGMQERVKELESLVAAAIHICERQQLFNTADGFRKALKGGK